MSTGKAAQIPDALLARCLTLVTGSPTLPLALPDIEFDPKVDAPNGKYLAVEYFPNRPAWEGLSAGKLDQGLLQITVHWPRGAGIIAPLEVVETIKTHFAKGVVLTSGATNVKLAREPWASAPLIEPTETCTPITIPWNA